MRKASLLLFAFAIVVAGCQKTAVSPASTAPATPATVVKPPTAAFRITTTQGASNNVLEGKVMGFVNTSQNGESYLWDFGNGTTSTEKVPADVKLWPCSQNVTVTLTVTNKNGQTATYSQPYFVICARTIGGKHEDH